MDATDPEVERIAADLIAKHGPQAAWVAAERLNRMIDRSDTRGRDLWACVVHAIHQRQGGEPADADRDTTSRSS